MMRLHEEKSEFALDKMESILECSVCFEIFENPRVLPCQHTFCSHCLVGIAKAREGIVVCPQCRENYRVPRQGVDNFPANFFIKNVLDFINDGSLLRKENNCSSCASINVASCRCLFCGEFLCQDCGPKHEKQKEDEGDESCGKHQIADLSALANASNVKPKSYPVCPKHSDEILKYHCEDCERAICRDCSVFDHREHKVILLKDALKELRGTVGEMLKEGREKIPQIKKSLENTGSLREKLKVQYENTCAVIQETKHQHLEELKKSLDSREKELLDELQGCFETKNAKLLERQKHLELTLGKVMSVCDFAENKLSTREQGEYISSRQEILDCLKGIEAGSITGQEDPSAGILWDYLHNSFSSVLRQETQKAMGYLVISDSRDSQSSSDPLAQAQAASHGLDESISSSASPEHMNNSQFSEEDTVVSGINRTSSAQASNRGLLGDMDLNDLITRIYGSSPGEFYPPSMHCNICERNNHTERYCHAKYDVHGQRIHLEDVTCYQCGQDGHFPKDCWNHSISSESWLTVEDSGSDEYGQSEAYYTGECTRCGRTNHVLSECYARYNMDGERLPQIGNNENRCTRCGRKNHHVSNCHARYSVSGRRL